MDSSTFWDLVDASREGTDGDLEAQGANLVALLDALPLADVAAFDARLGEANLALHTWGVVGAGTVLLGRMSDDVFTDLRTWVVAHGRAVHERVLADPDSLADVDADDVESVGLAEEVAYAAHRAYESRTGRDLLDDHPGQEAAEPAGPPAGESFDPGDDAELRRRYPRLAARWLPAAGPLPGRLPPGVQAAEEALAEPDGPDEDARPPVSQVLADAVARRGLTVTFASETSTDPRHRAAHLLTTQGPALLAEVETVADAGEAADVVARSRHEHTTNLGDGEQVQDVAGLGDGAFRRVGDGITLVRARRGTVVVEVQVSVYLPDPTVPAPTADEVAGLLLDRFAPTA
ncbi:DUF4240 domain-containing protein [Kineosporia sp. A_224]|uniref:DUF4240 domain-containing protein n=1 Tax=Kineosporia sp. A_224 TaxID=1962180 RepID=UPI000B4C05FF|nr:DUF4240 domain-containing protein [Kineosporia sp. A_224]